jgi:hypothetical protein
MNRHLIGRFLLTTMIVFILVSSCTKRDEIANRSHQPSNQVSDVLDKWMSMQLRLMKNAVGIPNQAFSRHFAYAGIAAVESLAPDLPAHLHWRNKWNGLSGLPFIDHAVHYYYPANMNAAMAAINKSLFPNASNDDKAAIDSLENALNQEFLTSQESSLIHASAEFGKSVAVAVFNWSETDGYKNASNAYTPPTGAGLWKPTTPVYANASTPYWGNNRPVIIGSIDNAQPDAPFNYSSDPNSLFYQMANEVFVTSQHLTDEQKATAIFWRDVPGTSSPGHWLSILQQVIRQTNTSVDKAALAYAITGAAINDALISCWKAKYQYNLIRPITYIREVMGQSSWNSHLATPAHPEYPSAHSVLSSAAAEAMENLFGNIHSFTDHTYDYLGFAPRSYSSFTAIGEEAAHSRLYAGIHFRPTIENSLVQGRKVTSNIFSIPINE